MPRTIGRLSYDGERGVRGDGRLAELDPRLTDHDLEGAVPGAPRVASSMFIAGLPMKPPTNMFSGRW